MTENERAYLNTIDDEEKIALLEHYYNVDLDDTANGLVDVLFNGFKHKVGIAIDIGENINERIELREFMSERSEDD